jgi:MFS family permease
LLRYVALSGVLGCSIWTAANVWQYCVGLLACSQVTTYDGLMAARVIHCFGSSVCEALPVQLVNDIFFLHERGKRLGYYTGALLCCFSA